MRVFNPLTEVLGRTESLWRNPRKRVWFLALTVGCLLPALRATPGGPLLSDPGLVGSINDPRGAPVPIPSNFLRRS